jgi:2-amino-4-hydroxy-6-hydroxymethyldihydropteridine diphosphokinase
LIRIAVGLGSNVGERKAHLTRAVAALSGLGREIRLASLYETAPVGPPQPDFLNSAISFVTPLSAMEVLHEALAIERRHGRVREVRWGPRTLDLDLLAGLDAAGEPLEVRLPGLTVPHPELGRRAFALAPLLEVLPEQAPLYAARLVALGGAPRVIGRPRRDGKGWTARGHRK